MPERQADVRSSLPLPERRSPYRRANEDDFWFRHLIEGQKNTLNRDRKLPAPRVKVRYITDKFAPPSVERPWALELSGRMLNLCSDDIRSKAQQAAESAGGDARGFRFEDICWKAVRDIRRHPSLDVFLEDIPEYDAHANLVIVATEPVEYLNNAAPKQAHQIYRDIAELLVDRR
jgi:hypothetical protein